MKKYLFLIPLLLVFAVSCGDSGEKTEKNGSENSSGIEENQSHDETGDTENLPSENDSDASGTSENGDNGSGTGTNNGENSGENGSEEPGEEETPDETPQETEKFCQYACKTPSDCVPAASNAINDADNYKCENGKCVYTGCNSDDECDEIYGAVTEATGTVYRCNKNGPYGYSECTPVCSTAADCTSLKSTENAYDLDNYKCDNGMCVYTGCNSDDECANLNPSENYKCFKQEYAGKTMGICQPSCTTAADCANSVYPEEFYECRNSQCITKSCESDEWCAEYMTDDYVCI